MLLRPFPFTRSKPFMRKKIYCLMMRAFMMRTFMTRVKSSPAHYRSHVYYAAHANSSVHYTEQSIYRQIFKIANDAPLSVQYHMDFDGDAHIVVIYQNHHLFYFYFFEQQL